MRNSHLLILPGLALVLTAGCSGPSVTSSDTSGTTDQALSVVKKDIDAKKDETLVAGTVIRTSLQHALRQIATPQAIRLPRKLWMTSK